MFPVVLFTFLCITKLQLSILRLIVFEVFEAMEEKHRRFEWHLLHLRLF